VAGKHDCIERKRQLARIAVNLVQLPLSQAAEVDPSRRCRDN
jgi:hypothetical protein